MLLPPTPLLLTTGESAHIFTFLVIRATFVSEVTLLSKLPKQPSAPPPHSAREQKAPLLFERGNYYGSQKQTAKI